MAAVRDDEYKLYERLTAHSSQPNVGPALLVDGSKAKAKYAS
jgi:hypothetical protein